jgi:hypothetical protein
MNNQLRQVARSTQNDFGTWVRNATDKGTNKFPISSNNFLSI